MIAFVLPVIVLCFSFLLKIAGGPYWQFPDPCYGYLSSSLSLFRGFSPTFNYQPGTSVEILGAIVIFFLNIGHSTADSVHRVLVDPDLYLNAMNIVMILLVFLTSSVLGAYVFRQTKDTLAVLLSQLPLLCFLSLRSYSFYDYVLPVLTNVSPEPLMISIGMLFNLFFLKLYFAVSPQEETLATNLLGFICGLAVTTRLTFFPSIVLPLIVCRPRLKLLFIIVFAVSCVLCTIPIIAHYAWIWQWIVKLSTHQGGYGSGNEGFINFPLYWAYWHIILDKCEGLILLAAGALLLSSRQIIKNPLSRESIFLLAALFSVFLQFALVAKCYDDHYLVSAISSFGPVYVLGYLNAKNKGRLLKTAVLLGIIIFFVQSMQAALAYNKQLSTYTKDTVNFNNTIHAQYPNAMFVAFFPMPLSIPEAAFFWGNDRDNRQQEELANLYPQSLAYFDNNTNDYAPYVSGIYSIKQRVWADDLIHSGRPVIFMAPKVFDFSQTPYSVLPIEQGRYAGAFLLTGSTEKEAQKLFDASINLLNAGNFPQAFVFALKSHNLHYIPGGQINFVLNYLYLHIKH